MDFVNEVHVIEDDIEDVNNKCNKIQCGGVYDAFKAVIKLIVDIFRCFKPKIFKKIILKEIIILYYINGKRKYKENS
jgi:hypothetical protein